MLNVILIILLLGGLAGLRGMINLKKINKSSDDELRLIAHQTYKENFM